jgi:hypothetical protein
MNHQIYVKCMSNARQIDVRWKMEQKGPLIVGVIQYSTDDYTFDIVLITVLI